MRELIAVTEPFFASHNEEAQPFVWTKSVVHQKRMKPCFAVQRCCVLAYVLRGCAFRRYMAQC